MNNYLIIKNSIPGNVKLVAVTKTRSIDQISALYEAGHRQFGENRVSELQEKYTVLNKDIEWHMIGHLQRNKVKYIAPFVYLIHSVDSLRLAKEINKQAANNGRIINILLQLKIGQEEAKSGFSFDELNQAMAQGELQQLSHINICGVMGMASFVSNEIQIKSEFSQLRAYFDKLKTDFYPEKEDFNEVSMGMSGDYKIALSCGSTMLRIGSLLFN